MIIACRADKERARRELRVGRLLVTTVVLLLACPVAAEDPKNVSRTPALGDTPAPIAFSSAELKVSTGQIEVFNGIAPDDGDWTSLFVATLEPGFAGAGSKESTCTATFVGRNVLLTAAHCVVRAGEHRASPISIGSVAFTCSADPSYVAASDIPNSARTYDDFALCAVRPEAVRPAALERVRWDWIDPTAISADQTLLLAGFGCVTWTFNGATGTLFAGPRQKTVAVGDIVIAEVAEDHFVSLSDGKLQPAVCAGDSGGPAFSGVRGARLRGARVIRGVASMNPVESNQVHSYFAALSSKRFRTFLECWKGAHPDLSIQVKGTVAAKSC